MKAITAIAVVLALAATACGFGESSATSIPVEPTTREDLDAAVVAAASELLASPQVTVAVVYYAFDNPEEIVRYTWIDYRTDGEVLVFENYLEENRQEASVRVNGEWWAASGDDPWHTTADLGAPEDVIATISELGTMANQGSLPSSGEDSGEVGEASVQTGIDKSHLWRIVFEDGAGNGVSHEWIVNNDGILQFERLVSAGEPISGAGALVLEYTAGSDPDPIGSPEPGSSLEIGKMGMPGELIEIGI